MVPLTTAAKPLRKDKALSQDFGHFSFRSRKLSRFDMPCTQIPTAQLKNDLLNPFSTLSSREIIKVNQKFCGLKEKLFLKDKVIQDKIQLVQALTFFHNKQIEMFKDKMTHKNFKLGVLTKKCDKMLEINKEQNGKLDKFADFYDKVKDGISLSEL